MENDFLNAWETFSKRRSSVKDKHAQALLRIVVGGDEFSSGGNQTYGQAPSPPRRCVGRCHGTKPRSCAELGLWVLFLFWTDFRHAECNLLSRAFFIFTFVSEHGVVLTLRSFHPHAPSFIDKNNLHIIWNRTGPVSRFDVSQRYILWWRTRTIPQCAILHVIYICCGFASFSAVDLHCLFSGRPESATLESHVRVWSSDYRVRLPSPLLCFLFSHDLSYLILRCPSLPLRQASLVWDFRGLTLSLVSSRSASLLCAKHSI